MASGGFQGSAVGGTSDTSGMPTQDDFYLLDVIGGANVSVMHPTKPIIAYTSGKLNNAD